MTEKKVPRTGIVPSDMDAQGNVILWDHGPQPPRDIPHETDEAKAGRLKVHEEDKRLWTDANGGDPVPVVMHSSDAGHAMMTDPGRYALEPAEVDEAEVEKRMKIMKDKREAARDFEQLVIDRRLAIAGIMSDRTNERLAKEVKEEPAPESFVREPVMGEHIPDAGADGSVLYPPSEEVPHDV